MARYIIRELIGGTVFAVADDANNSALFAKSQCEELARRSLACLNALSGIPDPAAFVEAARKVVQAVDDDNASALCNAACELRGKAVGGWART